MNSTVRSAAHQRFYSNDNSRNTSLNHKRNEWSNDIKQRKNDNTLKIVRAEIDDEIDCELETQNKDILLSIDAWDREQTHLKKKVYKSPLNHIYKIKLDKIRAPTTQDINSLTPKQNHVHHPSVNVNMLGLILRRKKKINKIDDNFKTSDSATKADAPKFNRSTDQLAEFNLKMKEIDLNKEIAYDLVLRERLKVLDMKKKSDKMNKNSYLKDKESNIFHSFKGILENANEKAVIMRVKQTLANLMKKEKIPPPNIDLENDITSLKDKYFNVNLVIQTLEKTFTSIKLKQKELKNCCVKLKGKEAKLSNKIRLLRVAFRNGVEYFENQKKEIKNSIRTAVEKDNILEKISANNKIQTEVNRENIEVFKRSKKQELTALKHEKKTFNQNFFTKIKKNESKCKLIVDYLPKIVQELKSIKLLHDDCLKLLKEVYLILFDSEKEYDKEGLCPILKQMQSHNIQIASEEYPRFLDQGSQEFLSKLASIELKLDATSNPNFVDSSNEISKQNYLNLTKSTTFKLKTELNNTLSVFTPKNNGFESNLNEVKAKLYQESKNLSMSFSKNNKKSLSPKNDNKEMQPRPSVNNFKNDLKELNKIKMNLINEEKKRLYNKYFIPSNTQAHEEQLIKILKAEFGASNAKDYLFEMKREKMSYNKKLFFIKPKQQVFQQHNSFLLTSLTIL